MTRLLPLAALIALVSAAAASAQAGGLEDRLRATDPRPGQRWAEARPEIGVREVRVHEGGRELRGYFVPPGGDCTLKIGGQNRLLVQIRPQMADRTAPEYHYAIHWTVDGGAEQKKRFRTTAHRTALFEGGIDGVPGVADALVIDLPQDGSHVVVIRVPAGAKAGVVLRLRYEEPKPSGKSYGSTTGPDSHRDTFWMATRSLLTFGYTDNAFQLSDVESHQWEEQNDNHPRDKFDRMASVGDFFLDSSLDAQIITPVTPVGRFFVGGTIDERWYIENKRLNSDTFGAYVRHQVVSGVDYKVFGSWQVDRFHRNLDPPEIPGQQQGHAHYDAYEIGGKAWVRWGKPLTTGVTYAWELQDWNTKFNERDSSSHRVALDVALRPAKWLTLELDLDAKWLRCLASRGETDRSWREISPRIAADVRVKRVLLGGSYRYAWRRYTTDNSRSEDVYYADRTDQRHRFRLYLGYVIGTDTEVKLAWERERRTVDLPGRSGSAAEGRFRRSSNSLELSLLFLWP